MSQPKREPLKARKKPRPMPSCERAALTVAQELFMYPQWTVAQQAQFIGAWMRRVIRSDRARGRVGRKRGANA
jgi:hypothetical protein